MALNVPIEILDSHLTTQQIERFWAKVDYSGRAGLCWPWMGALGSRGYGIFTLNGPNKRTLGAHRIAYAIVHGSTPAGRLICHSCDNPKCVNPAHLFAGGYLANMQDKTRKGRQVRLHGESNPAAKFTAQQILAIRADLRPNNEIAQSYATRTKLVWAIKNRKCWSHLEEADHGPQH